MRLLDEEDARLCESDEIQDIMESLDCDEEAAWAEYKDRIDRGEAEREDAEAEAIRDGDAVFW